MAKTDRAIVLHRQRGLGAGSSLRGGAVWHTLPAPSVAGSPHPSPGTRQAVLSWKLEEFHSKYCSWSASPSEQPPQQLGISVLLSTGLHCSSPGMLTCSQCGSCAPHTRGCLIWLQDKAIPPANASLRLPFQGIGWRLRFSHPTPKLAQGALLAASSVSWQGLPAPSASSKC